ncbi:hypothetical protein KAJ89_04450 [Candidatus Parcubacteria bacterium]|nr:hypothetical protein [Candidatus Parcubacteria bacterium]
MWLNFISRISSLTHNLKTKFTYAGVWKTIGLSAIVILLELFLLIISLPVYIFITPEKISKDKQEVERYRLKRKFSLIGVAGFLLLVLLRITLFSGLFFSSSIQVRALTLDWDFSNSADYVYDSNRIKLWDGMAIYNSQKVDSINIEMPIASLYPVNSLKTSNIIRWTGFTETANKNGGNIHYQLSDDDGQTWYYWDGFIWTEAGEHDYNEAATIDSQIKSFYADNGQIKFKAFFINNYPAQIKLIDLSFSYDSVHSEDYGLIQGYSKDNLWLYHDFGNEYWIFGIREASSAIAIDSNGQCVKFEGEVRKCSQSDYALLVSVKTLVGK